MANNLDRFNHLLDVISHDHFLSMQGIGNEVPFFICPYNPKDSLEMESIEKNLLKNLKQKGIKVLSINLYDFEIPNNVPSCFRCFYITMSLQQQNYTRVFKSLFHKLRIY